MTDLRESNQDSNSKVLVHTSSRGTIITGLAFFFLLFAVGGAWAWLTNISGAVIAAGNVVVLGKPKAVQHLDGGIASEILVEDGDVVKQGDVLVRLNDTLLSSNINIYKNRLRENLAQKARLLAERDERDAIQWNTKTLEDFGIEPDQAVRKSEQKLFDARKNTRFGQVAQLQEKLAQFENQISGIEAVKASKSNQLRFMDDELEGVRDLKGKGLALNSKLMALERQREELLGVNAELDANIARIQNSISEARIQILQIDREFRESVLTDLRRLETEINDLSQQLIATSEQLGRIEIKAPVAGVIHELSIFTVGGVIAPRQVIAKVIPQNEKFVVEADLDPQFVDELYPDQPATLRFSAFNQRTTPELNGRLRSVSADTVMNEKTGVATYKIRLDTTESEIARLGGLAVIPGMPVEVFLKTRERTPLNYLLKPISDQIYRAFKEE